MSGWAVLAVTGAWLGIGLALSVGLGRTGHDRFTWLVFGTIMGPMALLLALVSRRDERLEPTTVAAGTRGPRGGIDVLAAFDGSAGSRAALDACIDLFGDRLGRLTLVTVVPFDGGTAWEQDARARLRAEGERLSWLAPRLEVVHGSPAQALAAAAARGGYRLIVAGARGRGPTHRFASVADALTTTSAVPVLLLGRSSKSEPEERSDGGAVPEATGGCLGRH